MTSFTWVKKAVEVEAVQVPANGEPPEIMPHWLMVAVFKGKVFGRDKYQNERELVVSTPEGDMVVNPTDWIIRGVEGEIYPCKDTVFRKTYERPVTAEVVRNLLADRRP